MTSARPEMAKFNQPRHVRCTRPFGFTVYDATTPSERVRTRQAGRGRAS